MVNLEKEPTDLNELVEDVAGRFIAQADERDLVEVHGGTIEITSRVRTGTSVTVTLPT